MELGSEDRILHTEVVKSRLPYWIAPIVASSLAILFFATVAYTVANIGVPKDNRLAEAAAVFAKLEVRPLSEITAKEELGLTKLLRDPCNEQGIYALAEGVAIDGDAEWAADAYFNFAIRCGQPAKGDMRRAASLYLEASKYERVLVAADLTMKMGEEFNPNLRYWKAVALQRLGRYRDAVPEYEKTIQLLGGKTGPQVYEKLSQTYAAQRLYCDASRTMNLYVSRNTSVDPRYETMVKDFSAKCDQPERTTFLSEGTVLSKGNTEFGLSASQAMGRIARAVIGKGNQHFKVEDVYSASLKGFLASLPKIDGPGFDADPVTGIQEPDELMLKSIEESGSSVTIEFIYAKSTLLKVEYLMVYEEYRWRIDDIVYYDPKKPDSKKSFRSIMKTLTAEDAGLSVK